MTSLSDKLKDYKTYKQILAEAHKKGLKRIETKILQYPSTENGGHCIVQALVIFKDGMECSDVGYASPKNVNKMIAPHLVRMASTRSKGRALRDALNYGDPIKEEFDKDGLVG